MARVIFDLHLCSLFLKLAVETVTAKIASLFVRLSALCLHAGFGECVSLIHMGAPATLGTTECNV